MYTLDYSPQRHRRPMGIGNQKLRLRLLLFHPADRWINLAVAPNDLHPFALQFRHLVDSRNIREGFQSVIGVVMRSEVVCPQNNPTLQWALDEVITARTLLRGLHRRRHLEVERVETGRTFPIDLAGGRRTRMLLKDKSAHGKGA
jgi:hypothetical protein